MRSESGESMLDRSQLTNALEGWRESSEPDGTYLIGVLPGEGIGPEVTAAALDVLAAVEEASTHHFTLRRGGSIGLEAERDTGNVLPNEIVRFVDDIFGSNGAVLCGPGGGRFVYELRAKFDLYCKLVPLRPIAGLADAGVLRPEARRDVDILVVRENVGGVYFGESFDRSDGGQLAEARHHFRYDAVQVSRILRVAMVLAARRSGRLALVVKPSGIPAISRLWQEQTEALNADFDLDLETLEVDNACYQIVADAARFDVMLAPNMIGDILADTAAVLLGSRAMSYSANFGRPRQAVYQTGHGAAQDLAGTDRANPIGHIQSLGMLLHESFGLADVRAALDRAIQRVVAQGARTPDIVAPGQKALGTRTLGRRIAELTREELQARPPARARGAHAKSA